MNVMNYDRKALKRRAKEYMRDIRPRPWRVTLLFVLLAGLIPGAITALMPDPSRDAVLAIASDIGRDPQRWLAQLQGPGGADMLRYYGELFSSGAGMSIVTIFVTILVSLYGVVMNYGYMNYALKLYKGETTAYAQIFGGFPVAAKAIGASVMIYIYVFLWSLLGTFVGVCATLIAVVTVMAFELSGFMLGLIFLLVLAVWIAIEIFVLFVSYRYTLAPYYILTSDKGVFAAIRASKEEMQGNLGRYFVLELSFIGWELLMVLIVFVVALAGAFISIGLGAAVGYGGAAVGYFVSAALSVLAIIPLMLWLTPYVASAQAGFFLVVTGQDDGPAAPHSVPEYTPPQPSGIWDNVPPPPTFTTPAAEEEEAPEAPEPPAEPEAEPEPETEKPETAEPETPVAPEPPAETEVPAEPDPAEEEQGPTTEE